MFASLLRDQKEFDLVDKPSLFGQFLGLRALGIAFICPCFGRFRIRS